MLYIFMLFLPKELCATDAILSPWETDAILPHYVAHKRYIPVG